MIRLQNVSATVTAGGRAVAMLRKGKGEYDDGLLALRGVLDVADAFWLENAPRLDMAVRMGGEMWRWRDVTITHEGDGESLLTATERGD